MHPILRNILAVIAGIVVGSLVNMGVLYLGAIIFPKMMILETIYLVFSFLSHALGTLAASAVAAWIAFNHKMKFAMALGFIFLVGGVVMVTSMAQTPTWFVGVDLVLAYIPMAWIGGKIVTRNTSKIQMEY